MNYNQIKKNITESILYKHRSINEEIGIYRWEPEPVGGFRPESWGAYPSHFWLFIPGQGYQLMVRQPDGQFTPHPRPPVASPPNGNVYPIYFPNGTSPPQYPSRFYLKPNSGPSYGPGVLQNNPPEHVDPNLYSTSPNGLNSRIPTQQGQGYPWNPNWWRDPTYNLPYYFPGPGIIPTPITPDQQLVDPSDNFDVEVHNDWWTNPHWRLPPEFLEDSESGGSGSEDSGSGTNNPL